MIPLTETEDRAGACQRRRGRRFVPGVSKEAVRQSIKGNKKGRRGRNETEEMSKGIC